MYNIYYKIMKTLKTSFLVYVSGKIKSVNVTGKIKLDGG